MNIGLRICWILLFTAASAHAAPGVQNPLGTREDSLVSMLMAERAGIDSVAAYQALDWPDKAAFLTSFWQAHNPIVLQYYYGYHMGRRDLTVSDAFFERGDLIPRRYKTGAAAPDSVMLTDAISVLGRILQDNPEDLVAQNALGYCLLEAGQGIAAEKLFLKILQTDKQFVAARHGRALSCLIQYKRARRALDFFGAALPGQT